MMVAAVASAALAPCYGTKQSTKAAMISPVFSVGSGGSVIYELHNRIWTGRLMKYNKRKESIGRSKNGKGGILTVAASMGDILKHFSSNAFVHDVFVGVGVGLPCTVMECGDMIYRSTLPRSTGLNLTPPGVALALVTLSYLWATPGVAPGFWDMFVLAFVERLFRPSYRKDDFILGKKLGEGAFGVVYKASLSKTSRDSSPKRGDLVVKKATEYGAVEIWMNERVRRACSSSCADFVYGFLESSAKGKGDEYWLIWDFEGEKTLSDLMTSKEFPYNVSAH